MSVSLDAYRAAIGDCFPALPVDSLEYLAEGWESVACLVNVAVAEHFQAPADLLGLAARACTTRGGVA
jgi:hypothetical protein